MEPFQGEDEVLRVGLSFVRGWSHGGSRPEEEAAWVVAGPVEFEVVDVCLGSW